MADPEYDLFISYASEDKILVGSLADALRRRDLRVWIDRTVLKIGDSIRRKVDEGLSNSRYGVVILSPQFFKKQWPQRELDGLVAREVNEARKVILPVWHEVSEADVRKYSAPLADKVALPTSLGIAELARQIAELFSPREQTSIGDPEGIVNQLRRIPGVVAVELASRIVNGRTRTGLALRVIVSKKRPASHLPADARIPNSIGGISIDVVEES